MKARHIQELIASRRGVLRGLAGLPLLSLAGACATNTADAPQTTLSFASVPATNADAVTVPPGFTPRVLIAWGDPLFEGAAPFDPDTLTRAEQELRFGQNVDMLALFPAVYTFPPPAAPDRLILCANNEYANAALMFPALAAEAAITPAQVETVYASIGVSIVELARGADGHWAPMRNPAPGQGKNRRITPFTPVQFTGPGAAHPWIAAAGDFLGADTLVDCGTGANCAGGQTPWGAYLTAEENFDYLFGVSDRDAEPLAAAGADAAFAADQSSFNYPRQPTAHSLPEQFDMAKNPYGPALYGWIVEIDPYDPNSTPKKRTALGRKSAECATSALARDGRCAIYMGDDARNEFVYKFVTAGRFNPADRAANMDLLDEGTLYAARFEEDGSGRWLALTLDAANSAGAEQSPPIAFADQADVVMRARAAARALGATPMDRPEDVEALLDANWVGQGPVLIACTNNSERVGARPGSPDRDNPDGDNFEANVAGHIVRIDEAGADSAAETFTWDVFLLAGDPDAAIANTRAGRPGLVSTDLNGAPTLAGERFACPDNICIDRAHNVWIATDSSDGIFPDCNDSILVTPASGAGPHFVKRFLVGPVGAELCGPLMAPDQRAFFAAIQHPGENDIAGADYRRTRWNNSGNARPPSSFPEGAGAWPRAAVVVVTRDDGGDIAS